MYITAPFLKQYLEVNKFGRSFGDMWIDMYWFHKPLSLLKLSGLIFCPHDFALLQRWEEGVSTVLVLHAVCARGPHLAAIDIDYLTMDMTAKVVTGQRKD